MNSNDIKTILVTGASGFLGKEILRQGLLKSDYIFLASTSNRKQIESIDKEEKIKIVPREYLLSKKFLETEVDCIINCAFPRNSSGYEMASGLKYLEECFFQIAKSKVKAIINISSQSVYDSKRETVADENTKLSLDNSYATGKYMTERLLECICPKIAHTNLRMASLIGPGFNQRIVNRFVMKAMQMTPIHVVRSRQSFGFLDVSDAARSIFFLLNMNIENWKKIYNVGSGNGYTVEEMLYVIQQVFLCKGLSFPEITYSEEDISGSTAVSYNRLQKDTGYKPKIPLSESVELIYKWFCIAK